MRSVPAAWLVSRVVAAVGLTGGAWYREGSSRRFSGFFAWDGQWYLRAATDGYGGVPLAGHRSPWPFFPLLPGLLRLSHDLGLPAAAVIVVVNHLLVLVALVGLWHLADRRFGSEIAVRSVWALALFPMAGVFSMLYPSAIFLAASVWAFEFVARRQWAFAGVAVSAATMARPNGAVTAVLVAWVAWRASPYRQRFVNTALVAGPSAAAVAVWVAVCATATGNPFVFVTAKAAWNEQTVVELARRLLDVARFDSLAVHVLLGLVGVAALRTAWNELEAGWRALAIVTLVVPLATGLVGLGRYGNECFPIAIAAGTSLSRLQPRAYRLVLLSSGTMSLAVSATIAAHGLVP